MVRCAIPASECSINHVCLPWLQWLFTFTKYDANCFCWSMVLYCLCSTGRSGSAWSNLKHSPLASWCAETYRFKHCSVAAVKALECPKTNSVNCNKEEYSALLYKYIGMISGDILLVKIWRKPCDQPIISEHSFNKITLLPHNLKFEMFLLVFGLISHGLPCNMPA